ncbi:hypothetical protein AB0F36_00115 [Streptomyces sp. NPDC029080]|uniref:hypothetical protein n=1 Tax=Streptomyces sp. NPDC029080 TaxID=3155017 RepID=UPI0033EBAEB6
MVAKLQLAEAQVDTKGVGGLRSLAALLTKIGNSYAARTLAGFCRSRDFEGWFRWLIEKNFVGLPWSSLQ